MEETIGKVRHAVSGRYEIQRELGRGGMARVYLADDRRHRRLVAIKVLNEDLSQGVAADRFLSEITIAAQLAHPHIVPVFDSGADPDCLYYVMPYIAGETLRSRLERGGPLPIDEAVRLAHEVCDALAYAHARNVVHRDIKPENILLADGHALIADFGIARAIQQTSGDRLTTVGVTVGTPLYMSPEQAWGERDIDGRSDVFSLGCVLYEMLAGHPLRDANAPAPIAGGKRSGISAQLESAGGPFAQTLLRSLERALAMEPRDRSDAREFASTLADELTPHKASRLVLRSFRRKRSWIAAAVAVAIGAASTVLARRPSAPAQVAHERVAVAVFPFRVDAGSAQWQEAIPDLLATSLDGVPGLFVADPWSIWRDLRPDRQARAQSPDVEQATRLSRRAHADYFILGSIAQLRPDVRINVRIYRVGTAEPWQTFGMSASSDSVAVLARQISLEAIRRLATGRAFASTLPIERGLTKSPEALTAWLLARENRRRGLIDSANAAIDRALALDSSFLVARVDAAVIKSWLQFSRGEAYADLSGLIERVVQMGNSVPERPRLHAQAMLASINTDGVTASRALNRILSIDSTDFDAWKLLSYVNSSYGWQYGAKPGDARIAAEHAVRLDSTDAEALVVRTYRAVGESDAEDLRRQLARLRATDTSAALIHGTLAAGDALVADDRAFALRLGTLAGAPLADWMATFRFLRMARPDRADLLLEKSRSRPGLASNLTLGATMQLMAAEGRWQTLDSLQRSGLWSGNVALDLMLQRVTVSAVIGGAGNEGQARRAVSALAASLPSDSVSISSRVWHDGWLIGAFHAMHGDTIIARRWHLAMDKLQAKSIPEGAYGAALRDDIAARMASRRGDRAEAMRLARQAFLQWRDHTENQREIMPEPAMRFHLATLLRAAGASDSAAALFQSLMPPTTWMGFYTARAALEYAELKEEARDVEAAQRGYLIASDLWNRGDSTISALRDRARRGAARRR